VTGSHQSAGLLSDRPFFGNLPVGVSARRSGMYAIDRHRSALAIHEG
jgi:hypothetical protein